MLKHPPILLAFLLGFPICLTNPLPASAETKVIFADTTYTMGDGESPSFAEAQVLQRAKQIALEQAGTYVESYAKVRNYDLTTEEIQTLAGGVVEVDILEKSRKLVGDGLRFNVKIKATVTTDKMEELAQRVKGKNVAGEYANLQKEYAKLNQELETLKRLVATNASGQERVAALDQIRNREKAFAEIQQSEETLFQRLISGESLVRAARGEKGMVDDLLRAIMKDGHVIKLGTPKGHVQSNSENITLTLPVTVKISNGFPALFSRIARRLGGVEVPESSLDPGVPTTLQLSSDPYLQEYFRNSLGGFELILDFNFNNATIYSCSVDHHINRIFPAHTRMIQGRFLDPFYRNYHGHDPPAESIVLIFRGSKVIVALDMPPEKVKELRGVTAEFRDVTKIDNAVYSTPCAIVQLGDY